MAGTFLKHVLAHLRLPPEQLTTSTEEAAPNSSCFILKITVSPEVSCPIAL